MDKQIPVGRNSIGYTWIPNRTKGLIIKGAEPIAIGAWPVPSLLSQVGYFTKK